MAHAHRRSPVRQRFGDDHLRYYVLRVNYFRHLVVVDGLRKLDGAVISVRLVHRTCGWRWLNHLQIVIGGGDGVDHDVLGCRHDRNVIVHDGVVVSVSRAELSDLQVRRLKKEKIVDRKSAGKESENNLEERHVRGDERREILRVSLLRGDVRNHLLPTLDRRRAIVSVRREISVSR